MHSIKVSQYLAPCIAIAQEAGALIMQHYQQPSTARAKQDHSPVTDADIEANELITQALKTLTPDISIVAEEDELIPDARHATFWLVDPLDGTRSFVRGEPEFTVNIGLIHEGEPLLGVILAPAQNLLYYGGAGEGAWRIRGNNAAEKIHTRAAPKEGVTVVRSQSHPSKQTEAYLSTLSIAGIHGFSSSIKFCMVAEGSADIYPRFGRTMEWDTAAGHAILNAAGGRVTNADGSAFTYGKPHFENPAFIAFGAN